MVWSQNELNYWQKIGLRILKNGPIPRHIGFIMDGNRRYARNSKMATIKGHELGFNSMEMCHLVAEALGIEEVTMYAFSIENFKRPKEELDGLFDLMEKKLLIMHEGLSDMIRTRKRTGFIGNISLLPEKIQKLVALISADMEQIPDPVLTCYLALAYTSREEITSSIITIMKDVQKGLLEVSDIDENLIQNHLYTNVFKNPIDLVVRTSGETRLSDFLLWQSSDAVLYFTETLWPEFGIIEFSKAILMFQKKKIRSPSQSAAASLMSNKVSFDSDAEKRVRIANSISINRLQHEAKLKSFLRGT